MRLAVVSAVAIVVLLAVVAPAAGKAVLVVADAAPFTVRGSGFLPYERVTVVVQLGQRYVRTLTASKTGAFALRFGSLSLGACQGYVVRATGSRGSRAYLRFIPECNPP